MSKKKIIRKLYEEDFTVLHDYNIKDVISALIFFERRLVEEMNKQYHWYAVAHDAVMAGWWGGERRLKRRKKLLRLINTCRTHLGEDALVINNISNGLHYGHGVMGSYSPHSEEWTKLLFILMLKGREQDE